MVLWGVSQPHPQRETETGGGDADGLCPAKPAVPISSARSCPVRKSSSDSKSQPIFSVAVSTRRRENVLTPVEMVSLEAKMEPTAEREETSCDHTLQWVSNAYVSERERER